MNAAIVDTDVVSMLFKGDTRAMAYRPHVTAGCSDLFHDARGTERWALEREWGALRKRELPNT